MSKIAACLITKNSEATLAPCLDSIRPFVDGVFIYDTGSDDGTFELIEKLNDTFELIVSKENGASVGSVHAPDPANYEPGSLLPDHTITRDTKALGLEDVPFPDRLGQFDERTIRVPLAPITVERGEWRDNFSWAREQSFAMPSDEFEWMLWLDDDDVVEGGQWLRQLAATAHPLLDGFIFFYDYAQDEHGNNVCQLWRERLLRRSAGYVWKGAVHEVLVPQEGKQPNLLMLPPEQVRYVHHRPPDRYAPERNLEILLRDAEKAGPDVDPRTLAYIGTELMSQQKWPEAVPYLSSYLEHPQAVWSDERMQVHHKLATCLRFIGNAHASIECEFQALRERDDWAETHVGLAEGFAMLGNAARAEREALTALELGMPQSMLILNPLEFTFLPLVRIADACMQQGKWDEAQQAFDRAAAILPANEQLQARRAEFAKARREHDLTAAVLLLRETLVRHDENLKALNLLENVPYLVADRPEIVKAVSDQREMCKHYLEPEEYRRWYSEEPKESTLTDEHIDQVGEWFGRVKGLEEGLKEQEKELGRKPVLLDLGCNDYWMGEYFQRQGIRCDGVELNRRSYEIALERRARFKRDAEIMHGDLHDAARLLDGRKYDAVSLFEVIEHVPDIAQTLKVCESMLKPGGRVYISTPDGAFENGNLAAWAAVERKGHLRAIPIRELAKVLNERGKIHDLHVGDGDRVSFASYTPKRKRSSITLYAGGSWEPWSPASIREGGLGGSETALVQVATRLAQQDHRVTVYSGAEPGYYGGVLYREHSSWDPTEAVDLLIVSRLAHVFDNPLGAKATALWCHDHSYPEALTPERAERMTHIVCLSNWQRERFARLYPFATDKLRIIRNGISYFEQDGSKVYKRANRGFNKRKPRCVYSSSADRGLDVLLQLWPQIRERVPDAELHVFYGWDVFDRVALQNPGLYAYKAKILSLLNQIGGEQAGVFMRGRLGQRELAKEMMEARVWSYPTAFLETSCIGAMEARAAGLPIVTSSLGALKEGVGRRGILIPWSADEDEPYNATERYGRQFVERVVERLREPEVWTREHERVMSGAANLDWSKRVAGWEALLPSRRREKSRRLRIAA